MDFVRGKFGTNEPLTVEHFLACLCVCKIHTLDWTILKALVETIYDKYCAPKLNSISFLLDNSSSFRCRSLTLDS